MDSVPFEPDLKFDKEGGLDHKHLILHARVRNPERTPQFVENWLLELVHAIDMKVLISPKVVRCDLIGNEGVTGIICLQTSHASIHVWDKAPVPYLNMDLYSCKPFDLNVVVDHVKCAFDPYFVQTCLIDRNFAAANDPIHYDEQIIRVIDLLPDQLRAAYNDRRSRKLNFNDCVYKEASRVYNDYRILYTLSGAKHYTETRHGTHLKVLNQIKYRASRNNLSFDLDLDWYETELEKSKKKYPRLVSHQQKNSFWTACVDQIEPCGGYIKQNCRIIPYGLNVAKWNWTKTEIIELIDLLKDMVN
jgi:S-adenosylmethionine/arginine decarboxylase-like enzyme